MRAGTGLGFGAAMIVAGMAVIGFTDNFVRVIAEDAGLWQFHLVRSAMALPLLALAAAAFGMALRPRRPGAVAVRSAVNAVAMLLYFGSLPMMPIAQVGAALFTAPIWVLVLAAAFFGRPIGPRRMLAVGLGFAGVLVMLRPDPANLTLVTLMPVAAGALYGLTNLLTREWCADEPVGALLFGFFAAMGLAGALALGLIALAPPPAAWAEAAPFLTAGWAPSTARFLFWSFVQAAGSLVAVGMIVKGYQSGETSFLAVFEYFFLVSVTFWAWLIWGERLDAPTAAGIGLIVAAGLAIAGGARPPVQAAAAGWKRP
jgi:drug/metabolite transporter (DMT)-like permease